MRRQCYGRECDTTIMKDLCELYIKINIFQFTFNTTVERLHATLSDVHRDKNAENLNERPFNVLPYKGIWYNNKKSKT